ncbi:MAG TPA: TIGR04211 family SH3 domain-containing protein [Proteobacteria bacterium]|nr:TIGR04211 family SH3 domain-containing protein [Pseudomonadota bacterium]
MLPEKNLRPGPAKITLILFAFLLSGSFCQAQAENEVRYISDKIRVYARAGAGHEYKLIAPLVTGDKVILLENNDGDWAHISYGKDREGWIEKRFLTELEPAAKRLARLQEEMKQLEQNSKTKLISLTETNKEYRKGNTSLLREIKELRQKLNRVEKDYNTLREESAAFLELQSEHRKLLAENQLRQERESTILEKCELLKTAYRIKWFIAGSAVLLIGFAIGLLMQAFRYRRKKHSGLSLK